MVEVPPLTGTKVPGSSRGPHKHAGILGAEKLHPRDPVDDLPAVHAPAASHGRPFTLPSAPSAPAPAPTAAGFAAGGAAGGDGFGPGGWAAVLVALLGCCAAASMRPHRQSLALWRPLAFVSIQERPG